MGFPLADFIRTAAKKIMHQPETSGRFDGSFLCAETDDFTSAHASFNLLRIIGMAQLKKTPHLEMRSFAHSFLGLPLAIIMLGGCLMKLQQML